MIRSALLVIAVSSSISAALPAAAQENLSIHVKFSDLNLANIAGAQVLERRVAQAVEQICGAADVKELSRRQASIACRQKVMQGAQAQMAAIMARQAGAPRPARQIEVASR